MKRVFSMLLAAVAAMCGILGTLIAYGASEPQLVPLTSVPYLETIAFNNAEIDGGFQKNKTLYTITLDESSVSPTLKSYDINGDADIFVTYNYDGLNHQTGVIVTLAFESGSVIYTFNYSNVMEFSVSNNANLSALACEYAEVQPAINAVETSYKLYIPYDLTELNITPVTEDINAHCDPLSIEINRDQEPELSFTVSASDGTTKNYGFKVRRVDRTMDEVKAEKSRPDFISFVEGELFYQRPVFIISACAVCGGLLIIFLLAIITKRITVNPYDSDEKEFYSPA